MAKIQLNNPPPASFSSVNSAHPKATAIPAAFPPDSSVRHNTSSRSAPSTVEIMAPVGSYESLYAALNAGAGSIYFGVEHLNMRARAASNFTISELPKVITIARRHKVKTYLTLNTILYDHDLKLMHQLCQVAKSAGITAVIASDIAAILHARKIGLPVHLSTQTNITNLDSVRYYSQFADVIVLARELTLQQIKHIIDQIHRQKITGPSGELIKIEIFIHGALCVAISGKCYMSLATYNSSANRGACLQNCRRSYRVFDDETGDELVIDNRYIMSPKDLCTISFLDKIISVGVSILKIEGRGRSPEYVSTVVSVYKEALTSIRDGTYSAHNISLWTTRLQTVFNRGFWHGGYYLGKKLGDWSGTYGSQATTQKNYAGRVINYYSRSQIACCLLEASSLNLNDEIYIMGPTTGVYHGRITSLHCLDKPASHSTKGEIVTFPVSSPIRCGDKLYIIKPAL